MLKFLSFKQTRELAIQNNIDTGMLLIADEIEAVLSDALKKYTDDTYEEICSFAYNIYLKTEYTANEIALAIHYLLTNENLTVKQLLNLTKSEFLEMGIRYI